MADALFEFHPTVGQQVAELERELKYRAWVYPKLIDSKKLSRKAADFQNACLRAAIASLKERL